MAAQESDAGVLTSEEAYVIANQFALASSAVLEFRVANQARLTRAQSLLLEKCEDELDTNVVMYRNKGIMLLGADAAGAVREIKDAADHATRFLRKLADIEKAIEVAVGVLDLTRAILSHDVVGTLKAAKAVRDASAGAKNAEA